MTVIHIFNLFPLFGCETGQGDFHTMLPVAVCTASLSIPCFRSFYSRWFSTLYNAAFPPCSSEECLCRSPLCNPRYGRLCRSNGSPLHAAPCRSFDRCRNNTVFRSMRHPACRCSGTYRLSSVSFLSGPIASWANGDTFSFVPACIYSGRSQGRKSPPFCLPGRPLFIPPEPLFLLYHPFPPLLSSAGPSVQF